MRDKNHQNSNLALRWLALLAFWLAASLSGFAQDDEPVGNKLTILITGANRGLGFEYAKVLSAAGHTVIGTARKPEEATDLEELGAEVLKLDVTSDEEIQGLAKTLEGRRIDILINNAGYRSRESSREEIALTFSVNTMGPYFVTEALVPNLLLSDAPKIVNVSSRAGKLSESTPKLVGYNVSKAGVNMVTRHHHDKLKKKGVIVISLAPGHNKTDMGGKGANLEPEESAAKIIPFLLSLTKKHSGGFWFYDGTELPW